MVNNMGTKVLTDKETMVKVLRMRSRDFRNGVLKVLPLKHDKIVSKEMWETMASISDAIVTLNKQMVEKNGLGDNAIDESLQSDMRDLSTKCRMNMLTPAERKAKAKAAKALDAQIAKLMAKKANL